MAKELLSRGLAAFAAGDLEGAARAWLEAAREAPEHPQLRAYLNHLRTLNPELLPRLQAEGSFSLPPAAGRSGGPPNGAPRTTTSVPLPVPVLRAAPTTAQPALAPSASGDAPAALGSRAEVPPPEPDPARFSRPSTPPPADVLGAKLLPGSGAGGDPAPEAGLEATAEPHPWDGLPLAASPRGDELSEVPWLPGDGFAPFMSPAAPASQPEALPELSLDTLQVPDAPGLPNDAGTSPEDAPGLPSGAGASPGDAPGLPSGTGASPAHPADPWGAPTDEREAGAGGGLALLESRVAPEADAAVNREVDVSSQENALRDLLELDDFSGALAVAKELLAHAPDHDLAAQTRQMCEDRLRAMYASKIGDTQAVPRVLVAPDELIWLDLDHRAGFVLAQIDGVSSYEEIVEVAGMDMLESYRIIAKLVQDGVIGPT